MKIYQKKNTASEGTAGKARTPAEAEKGIKSGTSVRDEVRDGSTTESHEKGYYRTHACTESFVCGNCGKEVLPEGAGTEHRNHCPYCLHSVHVDDLPGDRDAECGGVMEPVAVWVRKKGEWALIHRCKACGALSSNRVAADDNPLKLMSIAVKPLANPPFPIERLEDMVEEK